LIVLLLGGCPLQVVDNYCNEHNRICLSFHKSGHGTTLRGQ
jgi:hypothetical protein